MESKLNERAGHEVADIIIVGAGLVGLAATVAFAQLGKRVVLIDAKKAATNKVDTWDERIYALTPATEQWLRKLGVWALLDNTRINHVDAMQLWNSNDEVPLVLSAEDANLSELAWIVESQNLMTALWQKIEALGVNVATGMPTDTVEYGEKYVDLVLKDGQHLSTKLLVAADGAHSFIRKKLDIATKSKHFNQTAIVANFLVEKDHDNVARQWFGSHETLAFLPLPAKHVSIVWSVSTEYAAQLLSLGNVEFVRKVNERSQFALGKLGLVSKVLSFELNQLTAMQLITERVVLVGDAAHQVHPMAGQGVNLGFRDVVALQNLIAKTHALQDIGEYTFLRQYERARKADIASMNGLTTGLDYLFANEQSILKKLSAWGMHQLDKQKMIKKAFIKYAVA